VPDVALIADRIIAFYNNGSPGGLAGTSAAAPLWAGVAALANQQSAAAGAAPLGFLNPLIYTLGGGSNSALAFRDVLVGNNTLRTNATKVYSAGPGYDLCTGWGTPKGQSLLDLLSPAVPPNVTVQPASTTVVSGGTARFSAGAVGTSPLFYQWLRDGNPISGANSTLLTLPSVPWTDSGARFSCRITNVAGSVISQAALLTVLPSGGSGSSNDMGDVPLIGPFELMGLAVGLVLIGLRRNRLHGR
jgi:hypothetical protein